MPPATPEVEADGRRLVDDDDAEAVGVVEDLLGVGVVRGPERVGADPSQELEVVDHRDVVVAPTSDVQVLVHAEALEVEGLAVDQEARARPPGRSGCRPVGGSGRRARRRRGHRPGGRRDSRGPGAHSSASGTRSWPSSPCPSATTSPSASRRTTRTSVPSSPPATTVDQRTIPVRAVEVGHHGDVREMGRRRRAQPDAADQTGVVEEVLEDELLAATAWAVVDDPWRDRRARSARC